MPDDTVTGYPQPALASNTHRSGEQARSVLVTGAAGFLGVHTVRAFINAGWLVWGLDRRGPTDSAIDRQRFLETDILTPGWEHVLAGCDAVVHLAGRPGARDLGRAGHDRDNVQATDRLIAAVIKRPGTRVIFASSSSVYGINELGAMREGDPCRPLHPYGESKLRAERSLLNRLGLRCVALRLFTVYGPGQRHDMLIARAIDAAFSGVPLRIHNPAARRDVTFVGDVANAILTAASEPAIHGVINIGSGRDVSVAQLLSLVEQHVGQPVMVTTAGYVAEPAKTLAHLSRARAMLNYQPRWPVHAGIGEQVAATLRDRARNNEPGQRRDSVLDLEAL